MQTTKTLYATLEELLLNEDEDRLFHKWGDGTEYEAISCVIDQDGYWNGCLVFKDERYSPPDRDIRQLQFKHQTPDAAGGALATARAGSSWEILVAIFKSLQER